MAATHTAITNTRTRQEWAEVINADWRKSIDSIIQSGHDLAAAKAELPHGEFLAMVEADLPFNAITAQRLMGLAGDPRITNASSRTHLPPSWRVLSALTNLSDDDFKAGVASGIISPETSLRKADAYQGAMKVPEGEAWGGERSASTLPKPSEAREVARATGRLVAASDGNIYSGATEEEGREYRDRRTVAFRIIEAIETLGDAPDAEQFFRDAEQHWFVEFRPRAIDDARVWLGEFKNAMGVVDA